MLEKHQHSDDHDLRVHEYPVNVLSMRNEPLTSTTPRKARILIRDNKAEINSHKPFSIRMLVPTGENGKKVVPYNKENFMIEQWERTMDSYESEIKNIVSKYTTRKEEPKPAIQMTLEKLINKTYEKYTNASLNIFESICKSMEGINEIVSISNITSEQCSTKFFSQKDEGLFYNWSGVVEDFWKYYFRLVYKNCGNVDFITTNNQSIFDYIEFIEDFNISHRLLYQERHGGFVLERDIDYSKPIQQPIDTFLCFMNMKTCSKHMELHKIKENGLYKLTSENGRTQIKINVCPFIDDNKIIFVRNNSELRIPSLFTVSKNHKNKTIDVSTNFDKCLNFQYEWRNDYSTFKTITILPQQESYFFDEKVIFKPANYEDNKQRYDKKNISYGQECIVMDFDNEYLKVKDSNNTIFWDKKINFKKQK